jgi:hypothetical protein
MYIQDIKRKLWIVMRVRTEFSFDGLNSSHFRREAEDVRRI